jgi:hypothetical protein
MDSPKTYRETIIPAAMRDALAQPLPLKSPVYINLYACKYGVRCDSNGGFWREGDALASAAEDAYRNGPADMTVSIDRPCGCICMIMLSPDGTLRLLDLQSHGADLAHEDERQEEIERGNETSLHQDRSA